MLTKGDCGREGKKKKKQKKKEGTNGGSYIWTR